MTASVHGRPAAKKPLVAGESIRSAATPRCGHCGTDAFLIYEEYVPLRVNPQGRRTSPASASYVCSRCGEVGGHDVPGDWAPPGWLWYS